MIGATIRTVRHRWRPILSVPYRSFARHSVIVGSSGSGKTNLMMRLWAGWYAAATAAYRAGKATGRCWSCWTARAARTPASKPNGPAACCTASAPAGWRSGPMRPGSVLWDLPPRDLGVLLLQMIETGDGAAAYYTDIMQAVVNLALAAPGGPPPNAASFLDRLDVAWLEPPTATACMRPPCPASAPRKPTSGDIQLRYATLLGRFGPALDGPGTLDGADAWYCILEGTREPVRGRSPGHGPDRTGRARRHRHPDVSGGRSCSPPTTTARVAGGCRSATCTNAAGPSGSACRSRRSPGRGSAAMTTSGTGSPPPPTAGSG